MLSNKIVSQLSQLSVAFYCGRRASHGVMQGYPIALLLFQFYDKSVMSRVRVKCLSVVIAGSFIWFTALRLSRREQRTLVRDENNSQRKKDSTRKDND